MAREKICGVCLKRGTLVVFKTRAEIMAHLFSHIENKEYEREEWESRLQRNELIPISPKNDNKERSEKHAEFLLWELSCEPRQDKN